MRNLFAALINNKNKLLLITLFSLLLIAYIQNKEVKNSYYNSVYQRAFSALMSAKGVLPLDAEYDISKYKDANSLLILDHKYDSEIYYLSTKLQKDNEGLVIPPNELIKTIPTIKTLTLSENQENSFPYSQYFDGSYSYSFPAKKRVITYIPVSDTNEPSGYICIGGNMKKTFDEQKPQTKEGCIKTAQAKYHQQNQEIVKRQQDTIAQIESIKRQKETQKNLINETLNKIEKSSPIYAVNYRGECFEFKNIYSEQYLATGGAFRSSLDCFNIGDEFKADEQWPQKREAYSIALFLLALISATPFVMVLMLRALAKGATSTSEATINFLGKVSKAVNHDKKIHINADIKIKKED